MKVYVATKWSRRGEAQDVIATLRGLGHTITHDWTNEEDPPPEVNGDDRAMFYAECAADDVNGVLDADVVLALHDATARGMYVEVGIAISAGVRVVVVNGRGDPTTSCPIFYYLPEIQHAATLDEALDLIGPAEVAA